MASVKVGLRYIEKWKTDLEKQVCTYVKSDNKYKTAPLYKRSCENTSDYL